MLSDPAAAAWVAAGRPPVNAPPPTDGRCGRCGYDGPTVLSSKIISEKFTAFDSWAFGSRRLCVPCAWAYSKQPTTQPAMLITVDTVTEYSHEAALAQLLTCGPLPNTHAVVLPTARRKHILPTTQWGHLSTDGLAVRWGMAAAQKLTDLMWLRHTVAATWPQLSEPAPPSRLMKHQSFEDWPRIVAAWTQLQSWRTTPALWSCARILSAPVSATSAAPASARTG